MNFSFHLFFSLIFSFLISTASVFSQGQWTWMNGSDKSGQPGIFGVAKIPSATNTPSARYEAAEWTDAQGRFWLYGSCFAYDSNSNFDVSTDMWMYDPPTNMWALMSGNKGIGYVPASYGTLGVPSASNTPGARQYCAATWTDTSGGLWIFGSATSGNDLWRYDIQLNMWACMRANANPIYGTKGVLNTINCPPPRAETSCTWTDKYNFLWMFGGEGGFNDLWKYDPSSNMWAWMAGDSAGFIPSSGNWGVKGIASVNNKPSPRSVYTSWKDNDDNLWFYGGEIMTNGNHELYSDVWKYEINSGMWTWMWGDSLTLSNDSGKYISTCILDTNTRPWRKFETRARWTDECGNLIMYGGGDENTQIGDLMKFDISKNEWVWLNGKTRVNPSYGAKGIANVTNAPPGRMGANGWQYNGELYLFGGWGAGISGTELYNDLWKYTPDPCAASECKKSEVTEEKLILEIPNVFTPNSDGLNDSFKIKVEGYDAYDIIIFNRWGEKLFQSNDATIHWDGNFKGENVSDGTYYYLIELKTKEKKITEKGFLTLIR